MYYVFLNYLVWSLNKNYFSFNSFNKNTQSKHLTEHTLCVLHNLLCLLNDQYQAVVEWTDWIYLPPAYVHLPGSTMSQDKSQQLPDFLMWAWIAHPSPYYSLVRPQGGCWWNLQDKHNLFVWAVCASGTEFISHSRWGLLLLLPEGWYANRCLLSRGDSREQHKWS